MDIQNSFNGQILQAMKTLVESNLNLTQGQQLVTKVIAANSTGITLKWGAQTLTVENQNPRAIFTPYVGQNVTLQVAQISPELVFKFVTFDSHSYETPPSVEKMNAMRLTLATAPLVNRIDESMKHFSTHAQNQQPVDAKVVGLVGHKIQLELVVDDHQGGATGKKMLISIERNQLQLLPMQTSESLKVGQHLTLAITKIGAVPEFKQLPTVLPQATIREEKIAAFMKQLLPKHESPSVLLSQLKNDLPHLEIENETLASSLKKDAAALFDHLPPKEQLFNPQKLRHLIYSSGLFFDTKNNTQPILKAPVSTSTLVNQPPATPVDLKMPLLNLLQHTSATNELKQLASTLLQNLLKKDTALTTPELEKIIADSEIELHAQLSPLTRAENIPQSLKTLATDILPNLKAAILENTGKNEMKAVLPMLENEEILQKEIAIPSDFKQDLLRLVGTLKQGIAEHSQLALSPIQVEQLENLQHKTENALAKVVLDQLHSVPKDDSGKQLWAFELPFLMNNQVETLKMEIHRDKPNQNVDTQAQHWSVNLTLTPPKLGEIECVISYQNGIVNTYFKNQQPQTTTLIHQHLENLKQQLQRVGLITGLMSAHNHFQPMKSAYSVGATSLLNETA